MLTSYHVHTVRSDGQSNLSEIVDAALKLGLDELGISDHYVYLPDGEKTDWSMPLDDLPNYVDELLKLKEELADRLVIRLGIEVDYIPDTESEIEKILGLYPFDYAIGSVHFVDIFPVDKCKEEWVVLNQKERNYIIEQYWDRVTQMADSRLFDIVGHLDLYKKFGFLPTIDISNKISHALDSIANADMAIEINTSGLYKDINEMYPSEIILQQCFSRSIPVQINSDAHYANHLTRSYDAAIKLATRVGYTSLVTYDKRRRISNPILPA